MATGWLYQRLAAAYFALERRERSLARDVAALARLFPAGAQLADLGCGSGEHVRSLAQLGYHVTGLDASPELIRLAQARSGAAGRFICGDFRQAQAGLRNLDGAYSLYGCFNYLTRPADLAAAFQATAQMLRPGGRFALEVWRRAPYLALKRPAVAFAERFADRSRALSVERRRRVLLDDVARAGRVRLIHEYALNLPGKQVFFAEEHPLQLFEPEDLLGLARAAGLELQNAGLDFGGVARSKHSGALQLVFVRGVSTARARPRPRTAQSESSGARAAISAGKGATSTRRS